MLSGRRIAPGEPQGASRQLSEPPRREAKRGGEFWRRAAGTKAARCGHGHPVAAEHGRPRREAPGGVYALRAIGAPVCRRAARSSSQMVIGAAMNQVE